MKIKNFCSVKDAIKRLKICGLKEIFAKPMPDKGNLLVVWEEFLKCHNRKTGKQNYLSK